MPKPAIAQKKFFAEKQLQEEAAQETQLPTRCIHYSCHHAPLANRWCKLHQPNALFLEEAALYGYPRLETGYYGYGAERQPARSIGEGYSNWLAYCHVIASHRIVEDLQHLHKLKKIVDKTVHRARGGGGHGYRSTSDTEQVNT